MNIAPPETARNEVLHDLEKWQIRLLLIEDSEFDADLLLREFRKAGCEPACQRVDSREGLEEVLHQDWDLAITDYQLPGFDGLTALALLRDAHPDLPVIMVSGRIGEETAVDVMRAGVRDYVMKDNLKRLIPVVRRELQEAEQRVARRRAEDALRLSEQRFSELAEHVDEVFWLASPDWTQSHYVSPAFYKIWGWERDPDPDAELPRPWVDAVHAYDKPMLDAAIRQAGVDGGNRVEFPEYRIIRPNGHVRWIKARAFLVRDAEGRVVRIAGTASDITTRRNAEESLLRSNRALRALSAANQALVRETDEEAFVAEVCRIIVDISGYCAAWVEYTDAGAGDGLRCIARSLQGERNDLGDHLPALRQRISDKTMQSVLAGEGLGIQRNILLDEGLPGFSVLILPLQIGQQVRGILTIVSSAVAAFGGHEVTLLTDLADDLAFGIDALRTREEHEHLQNQLLQARKMEAVGQLSGGIAHDFNNMLSSILGYAELALERPDDLGRDELDEYLGEIVSAGERARDLVGQMLSFSRTRKGEAGRIELRPVIKEAVKMLRFTLPASIELEVDPGGEGLAVNIDPVQLQQIVMNLCINARDAMQNKGRLDIVVRPTRVEEGDRPECRSCGGSVPTGDYVELSVGDSGAGMDARILERVFDPFFTTKAVGKGTGMGLSVVHGLVHEAGGHILVDSVPGEGTTFRLLMPASTEPAGEETKPAEAVPLREQGVGSARILVVDDEASVAGFLRELLSMAGYQVEVAGNGAEALETYRRLDGEIDLVITDQTMPSLTGAELAAQLLAQRPDLPVILCTGFSEDVNEEKAKEIGIQGYLPKPVPSRTLLGRVAELLSSEC